MRFFGLIVLVVIGVNACDVANKSGTFGRLARGHDAAVGQFPYVVRLKVYSPTKPTGFFCAGALIGTTWVLTAAHCVANIKSVKVYLGSIFKDNAIVGYNVTISDITVHPKFESRRLCNDIALIEIPPTKLCKKIAIIPLPKMNRPRHKYEDAYAIGCGWGQTSAGGAVSTKLQWGRLKILGEKDCPSPTLDNEMCTAMSPNFATPCNGDSGGPLALEITGELVGIASSGDKSCVSGKPAFYTRISNYLPWIKSVSGISY